MSKQFIYRLSGKTLSHKFLEKILRGLTFIVCCVLYSAWASCCETNPGTSGIMYAIKIFRRINAC